MPVALGSYVVSSDHTDDIQESTLVSDLELEDSRGSCRWPSVGTELNLARSNPVGIRYFHRHACGGESGSGRILIVNLEGNVRHGVIGEQKFTGELRYNKTKQKKHNKKKNWCGLFYISDVVYSMRGVCDTA